MQIKEILYSVGIRHKQTEEKVNLEVWAEDADKATSKVINLINYDGQYSWTGTGPLHRNNEVISRMVESKDK